MTAEDHDALARELLESDTEYRRLYEDHQECERRLEELTAKSLLSQDDEIEEKKLKIHKLALKDRMEQLLRSKDTVRATA